MEDVLIDTDVVLDFFFDRKPHSNFATEVFYLCEKEKIRGFVSPVILCNTYYLLRKTARHSKVVEKLSKLLLIIDVLLMDKEVVLNALTSRFNDFDDALQHYAAVKNNNMNIILTRNLKDYKQSDIAVLTPEMYLKSRKWV